MRMSKNRPVTRIAPDGLSYDVDNLHEEPKPNEVEVIQFLRPNSRRRYMLVEVPEEIAKLSRDMILSAEQLTTGEVAIYCRYKDEDEEKEFNDLCDNKDVDGRTPATVLIELIKRKVTIRGNLK